MTGRLRGRGVAAATLLLLGTLSVPALARAATGVTEGFSLSSPTPAAVDYSDRVTFSGKYTCLNGTDAGAACPTTLQSSTATFALSPAGAGTFATAATVSTSFQFTSDPSGCTSTCSVSFTVSWQAGRAGSTPTPPGTYDVRLTTTLAGGDVTDQGALVIGPESTTTTYSGIASGDAGSDLVLSATVRDADLGQAPGTGIWYPDANLGAYAPVSFALYDEANSTLVAGPVSATLLSNGLTFGSPTLSLPAAGTYTLRTTYPGNTDYTASSDADAITVNPGAPVDDAAPTVAISTAESRATSGWYNAASNDANAGVTVDVATADDVGVTSLACTDNGLDVGPLEATGDSFVLGDGSHAVECTVSDGVGNTGSDSATFDVDQTPPTDVAFAGGGLADGGSYAFWYVPDGPTGCDAADATSGMASCAVTGYATGIGSQTVTATATDLAGNVASASLGYQVMPWTLVGFSGLDMSGPNLVKGGRQSLDFQVLAASAPVTTTAAVVAMTQTPISCLTTAPTGAAAPLDTSGAGLRYNGGTGAFTVGWKVPKGAGGCWALGIETADGSSLTVIVQLR
jgi:hypothetical protein